MEIKALKVNGVNKEVPKDNGDNNSNGVNKVALKEDNGASKAVPKANGINKAVPKANGTNKVVPKDKDNGTNREVLKVRVNGINQDLVNQDSKANGNKEELKLNGANREEPKDSGTNKEDSNGASKAARQDNSNSGVNKVALKANGAKAVLQDNKVNGTKVVLHRAVLKEVPNGTLREATKDNGNKI